MPDAHESNRRKPIKGARFFKAGCGNRSTKSHSEWSMPNLRELQQSQMTLAENEAWLDRNADKLISE
jgi:hypothetical protein